jgi:hypothetical protein
VTSELRVDTFLNIKPSWQLFHPRLQKATAFNLAIASVHDNRPSLITASDLLARASSTLRRICEARERMATRTRSPTGFPDTTSINLNRLLSRLERIVLVEPSPQLRKSSYERARVSAVGTTPYYRSMQLLRCAAEYLHLKAIVADVYQRT